MNSENFWVNIPHQVLTDENLTSTDKLVYGEVSALCNKDGYCRASNRYIGEVLRVSVDTAKRSIAKLSRAGYLRLELFKTSNNNTKRKVFLCFDFFSNGGGIDSRGVGHTRPGVGAPVHHKSITENISTTNVVDKAKSHEEINFILNSFENNLDKIPADKYPRRVAQNIRQITYTFIDKHEAIYLDQKGTALEFEYVITKAWQWFMNKDYADGTMKLETFKNHMKVYLDQISKKLWEGVTVNAD